MARVVVRQAHRCAALSGHAVNAAVAVGHPDEEQLGAVQREPGPVGELRAGYLAHRSPSTDTRARRPLRRNTIVEPSGLQHGRWSCPAPPVSGDTAPDAMSRIAMCVAVPCGGMPDTARGPMSSTGSGASPRVKAMRPPPGSNTGWRALGGPTASMVEPSVAVNQMRGSPDSAPQHVATWPSGWMWAWRNVPGGVIGRVARHRETARRRSCRLVRRHLARPAVVGLAGRRAHHVVDHRQPARHLVTGDPLAAVRVELLE